MGVRHVDVLEDGDRVILNGKKTQVQRRAVPAGYVYLDGSAVGDVQSAVLRDRSHLADEGVVVVTVGIDHDTGEVLYGPDLDSHGLMDDPATVLAKAADAVTEAIGEHASGRSDIGELQKTIRQAVGRVITRRNRPPPGDRPGGDGALAGANLSFPGPDTGRSPQVSSPEPDLS